MPSISYQLYCSRNFPTLDDTLAMLAQAAAERQHMVKGQSDILLPEGEHLIETVREHADIETLLGEPGG